MAQSPGGVCMYSTGGGHPVRSRPKQATIQMEWNRHTNTLEDPCAWSMKMMVICGNVWRREKKEKKKEETRKQECRRYLCTCGWVTKRKTTTSTMASHVVRSKFAQICFLSPEFQIFELFPPCANEQLGQWCHDSVAFLCARTQSRAGSLYFRGWKNK